MLIVIRCVAMILVGSLTTTATAVEQVVFNVTGPKGTVQITIQQKTAAEDKTFWSSPAKGSIQTQRQQQLAAEDKLYDGTGYQLLDDNTVVNGYNIGVNQPTRRQICGGLALARVLKGAYSPMSGEVWKVVDQLGDEVEGSPAAGDIAVWREGEKTFHFALVARVENGTSFPVWVYSKDGAERIYLGPTNTFPVEKRYGQISYHRLDWDAITATRVEPTGDAPTADAGIEKMPQPEADAAADTIEIPDVDGLNTTEAYAKLAATGLPVSTTFVEDGPADKLNTVESLTAGKRLPRDGVIRLKVYGRAVPGVLNQSYGDALDALNNLGVDVNGVTVIEPPSEFLANKVVKQDIPAGAPLSGGKKAQLTVYGPYRKKPGVVVAKPAHDAPPPEKKKLLDISGTWNGSRTYPGGTQTFVKTIKVGEGGKVQMEIVFRVSTNPSSVSTTKIEGTIVEGDETRVKVDFAKSVWISTGLNAAGPVETPNYTATFMKAGASGMTFEVNGKGMIDAPWQRAN